MGPAQSLPVLEFELLAVFYTHGALALRGVLNVYPQPPTLLGGGAMYMWTFYAVSRELSCNANRHAGPLVWHLLRGD